MECKVRYISQLRTLGEIRQARRELAVRQFFAEERLAEDASMVFSWGNLLNMIAPRGLAIFQGIGGVVSSWLTAPKRRRAEHHHTAHRHAVHHAQAHCAAPTKHKTTHKKATALRTGEIEVQVELDPAPKKRTATLRN